MAKWPAVIKLDTAPSTHIESCEVMSPILHKLKQAPKMGEPAGSTTSEFESEADLVSECIFLVTAPWTHSADPPHLGPIHSLFQCLSTCSAFACAAPSIRSTLSSAAVMHVRPARPSFLSEG